MTPHRPAHFVMTLLVTACWLLLRQSLALPDLITAALLGLVLPRLAVGFLEHDPPPRRWRPALRLIGVVLWDILVSNLAVARVLLSPWARPQPAWVALPYTLQHPAAVMLLAGIVTNTPGTVSCVVDETGRRLLVHVLDGTDPVAVQAQIRWRYEAALKEIFE